MKTIKLFATFCAVVALCSSCLTGVGTDEDLYAPETPEIPADGELVLTATPTTIYADGEDFSTLKLTKGGVEITSDFTLYDGDNNTVSLTDMKFSTEKKGKYYFWASYGLDITETICIEAVEKLPDAPDAPDDDNPDKLNFKRRVLLIQFTGTGCGYCPSMTTTLRQIMSDTTSQKYNEKVVLAAAHRFNQDDPAYLEGAALDDAMGITSFPQVAVDMHTRTTYYNYGSVAGMLNSALSRVEAKAGIAAVSEWDEQTRTISITATVKAAQTEEFRIGAWLLEDGIYGRQSNYTSEQGDFNVHDCCIRLADSKVTSTDFSGHLLGEIEAGKTANHSFSLEVKSGWNIDNCRLVLFVTAPETRNGRKYFYVNNVVEMPVAGKIDYEYIE